MTPAPQKPAARRTILGGRKRATPELKAVPPARKPAPRVIRPVGRPAVMEFQSDALELETRKPPVLARATLYTVILAIGSAVVWASVSQVDEIVMAPGKLVTTQPLLVVQPLETSIIRAINVKPGDQVHRGQLLASLDPTITTADADQLRGRTANYDAQIARLEAELAEKPFEPGPNATEDQATQARLYRQRAASYAAKLRDFDAQIAHAEASLGAAKDEASVLEQRLKGLKEIDLMRSTLFEKGSGSRLTFLQGRDQTYDMEGALARVRGDETETTQLLVQLGAQRQNFIEDFRRLALENLVEVRDQRDAAAEDLKKAELREGMASMISPADAAVLEVAHRSIGSVVQGAEPLFTLVPLNVPLEAEVSVAANDIGHLSNGDPARIKIDAFPFQKHGTVDAKVVSISQDSFAPEGAGASQHGVFYKVRLALGEMNLRSVPKGFQMLPGMTMSAEINAGERSVISYFLYPLIRGLDESLREP